MDIPAGTDTFSLIRTEILTDIRNNLFLILPSFPYIGLLCQFQISLECFGGASVIS